MMMEPASSHPPKPYFPKPAPATCAATADELAQSVSYTTLAEAMADLEDRIKRYEAIRRNEFRNEIRAILNEWRSDVLAQIADLTKGGTHD